MVEKTPKDRVKKVYGEEAVQQDQRRHAGGDLVLATIGKGEAGDPLQRVRAHPAHAESHASPAYHALLGRSHLMELALVIARGFLIGSHAICIRKSNDYLFFSLDMEGARASRNGPITRLVEGARQIIF